MPTRPAPIYLDNHATTPMDPAVLKAMMPYLRERFGNPSSRSHRRGLEAARAMDRARVHTARLLGMRPEEIFFTGGATEANNIAIKGLARARGKGHLVALAIEHKSVLDPLRRLQTEGFRVQLVSPGRSGVVEPRAIEAALRRDTFLVCVMAANNEIGTVQPVSDIARLCRRRGVPVLCDAAQGAGKLDLPQLCAGVDLLTLSAHKYHGPKGVGVLAVRGGRSRLNLIPLTDGGAQEGGLRSGTPNVAGVVGLGEASRLAVLRLDSDRERLLGLRKRFWGKLLSEVPDIRLNADPLRRLSGNLSIFIEGVRAQELLDRVKEVEFSAGSACLTSSPEPSYVLKAIGLTEDERECSVRFGFARTNTVREIDRAVRALVRGIRRIRHSRGHRS